MSSLQIIAYGANGLEDVERFGKNDPYARFTVNLDDKNASKKTKTHHDGGKTAVWNDSVVLENLTPEQTILYVDVIDQERGVDEPISFTAIDLHQVFQAPNNHLAATFDLYNEKGKARGEIYLSIYALSPGQPPHEGGSTGRSLAEGRRGQTIIVPKHQANFKKAGNKEGAQDVAVAAGAAALAAGAYALYKNHKADSAVKKAEKREA
ncbi:hypothetical protein BGW38_001563 [Lunasporangiospora selenospora]|uniref:C2 domain-containing protein n=1 Tax=Lunasporangiospora selenospora TaxID=979761 RepID=A0A9P6G3V8_9FUNG|nr:hypothetical protein BGW38_001563 [Lunasporangiospora selenospora]